MSLWSGHVNWVDNWLGYRLFLSKYGTLTSFKAHFSTFCVVFTHFNPLIYFFLIFLCSCVSNCSIPHLQFLWLETCCQNKWLKCKKKNLILQIMLFFTKTHHSQRLCCLCYVSVLSFWEKKGHKIFIRRRCYSDVVVCDITSQWDARFLLYVLPVHNLAYLFSGDLGFFTQTKNTHVSLTCDSKSSICAWLFISLWAFDGVWRPLCAQVILF